MAFFTNADRQRLDACVVAHPCSLGRAKLKDICRTPCACCSWAALFARLTSSRSFRTKRHHAVGIRQFGKHANLIQILKLASDRHCVRDLCVGKGKCRSNQMHSRPVRATAKQGTANDAEMLPHRSSATTVPCETCHLPDREGG